MKKGVLKELRLMNSISQKEFAKKLGVSQQAVASWEVDRTEPSHEILKEIADCFNVSTDYLLGRNVDGERPPLSRDQEKLITGFEKLSKTNQQIISYIMSTFLTQQAASVFGSVINSNNGNGNFFANNGDVYV